MHESWQWPEEDGWRGESGAGRARCLRAGPSACADVFPFVRPRRTWRRGATRAPLRIRSSSAMFQGPCQRRNGASLQTPQFAAHLDFS